MYLWYWYSICLRDLPQLLQRDLDRSSQVSVKEAEDGEVLKPGWVYIAPGGRHLELSENRSGEVIANILNTPPVNSLRPCADVMYDSIQKLHYDEIICVVLTGMGADGSRGIKRSKAIQKNICYIRKPGDLCSIRNAKGS